MDMTKALKYLTNYVTTYTNQFEWKKYHKDTWLADILYGLGMSVDDVEYRFADGYNKFMLAEIKPLVDEIERRERGDEWTDDSIQFPRLLAEIMATQDSIDFDILCDSMDLTNEEIHELFDRAQSSWETAKENI